MFAQPPSTYNNTDHERVDEVGIRGCKIPRKNGKIPTQQSVLDTKIGPYGTNPQESFLSRELLHNLSNSS